MRWINIIYIPHLPFIETDWLNWRQIRQLKRYGFCYRSLCWNSLHSLHASDDFIIGHVRYINILTWLRGFQVKLLYLVLFLLYLSLLWELRDKRNLKNLQFWPESPGAMLEYWYIERGLFTLKNFIDFLLPPSYGTNVSSKMQKKTFLFLQELKRSSLRLILTLWLSECRGYHNRAMHIHVYFSNCQDRNQQKQSRLARAVLWRNFLWKVKLQNPLQGL